MVCYDLDGKEQDDCSWEIVDMFSHEVVKAKCENCGDEAQFKLDFYYDDVTKDGK